MQIPLASFTLADGSPLSKFADGASATPGLTTGGSLRWNNHASPAGVYAMLPNMLHPVGGVIIPVGYKPRQPWDCLYR